MSREPVICRQGDVLLIPAALPVDEALNEVPRELGRIVLAHGEATGHAHVIREPNAILFEQAEQRYLAVHGQVRLVHEEHGSIVLTTGTYRVVRQIEYAPRELRPDGSFSLDYIRVCD